MMVDGFQGTTQGPKTRDDLAFSNVKMVDETHAESYKPKAVIARPGLALRALAGKNPWAYDLSLNSLSTIRPLGRQSGPDKVLKSKRPSQPGRGGFLRMCFYRRAQSLPLISPANSVANALICGICSMLPGAFAVSMSAKRGGRMNALFMLRLPISCCATMSPPL